MEKEYNIEIFLGDSLVTAIYNIHKFEISEHGALICLDLKERFVCQIVSKYFKHNMKAYKYTKHSNNLIYRIYLKGNLE